MRLQAAAATAQDVGGLTAPATPLVNESVDLSSQLGLDNIRQSLIRQARDLRCDLPAFRLTLHTRPRCYGHGSCCKRSARVRKPATQHIHSMHGGHMQAALGAVCGGA